MIFVFFFPVINTAIIVINVYTCSSWINGHKRLILCFWEGVPNTFKNFEIQLKQGPATSVNSSWVENDCWLLFGFFQKNMFVRSTSISLAWILHIFIIKILMLFIVPLRICKFKYSTNCGVSFVYCNKYFFNEGVETEKPTRLGLEK